MGYVPDGMTEAAYKKMKDDEMAKMKKGGLGSVGPKGFKSRSMQSFLEARERGEATHLFPVFNAKEKVASGELKAEDIPYMQRGGKWDNSDIKGAKQLKWNKKDEGYGNAGYGTGKGNLYGKTSVSIFGGDNLPWLGGRLANEEEATKVTITNAPKLNFDKNGRIQVQEKKAWWKVGK